MTIVPTNEVLLQKNLDAIQGSVYLIQCTETGRVKIGWSNSPGNRLSDLQIGCPTELMLRGIIPNSTKKDERALHRTYQKFHVRGEWFSSEVLEGIEYQEVSIPKPQPPYRPGMMFIKKPKHVECKEVLERFRGLGWINGHIIKIEFADAREGSWSRARKEMGGETRHVIVDGNMEGSEWRVKRSS